MNQSTAAALVRTSAGLVCRISCHPPVVTRQEVPVSRPIAAHRNPRSYIATIGAQRLLVILEDRDYHVGEVARLVAIHAAAAVEDATGEPVASAVKEAKYIGLDER